MRWLGGSICDVRARRNDYEQEKGWFTIGYRGPRGPAACSSSPSGGSSDCGSKRLPNLGILGWVPQEPSRSPHADYAGDPVSGGLVKKGRRDGRINPAGKAADHSVRADFPLQVLYRPADKRGHRPGRPAMTNLEEKIFQDLHPFRRMGHFRMELNPELSS